MPDKTQLKKPVKTKKVKIPVCFDDDCKTKTKTPASKSFKNEDVSKRC